MFGNVNWYFLLTQIEITDLKPFLAGENTSVLIILATTVGSSRNPNWFFYGISKPLFETFIFKNIDQIYLVTTIQNPAFPSVILLQFYITFATNDYFPCHSPSTFTIFNLS